MELSHYSELVTYLISRVRLGCQESYNALFELLYIEEAPWLIIEAMRRGVREDDTIDAAFSAIVNFMEKFSIFRGTTIQEIRHVLRFYISNEAKKYRKYYLQGQYPNELLEFLNILPENFNTEYTPHHITILFKEILGKIQSELTQDGYKVWFMRVYYGKSYDEISNELGFSLRKVERLLENSRLIIINFWSIHSILVYSCFKPRKPKVGDVFTVSLKLRNLDIREITDISLIADIRGRKTNTVAMNITGEGVSQPWRFSWKRLNGDNNINIRIYRGNQSRYIILPLPEVQ